MRWHLLAIVLLSRYSRAFISSHKRTKKSDDADAKDVYPVHPGADYVEISRTWSNGETVLIKFPASLWVQPLGDKHAEYNATV